MMKSHIFLDALNKINYGRIILTLPDGTHAFYYGLETGPEADWQVHDWRVFDDFIARGEIGFADAYMDGRWDSSDLVALSHFGLKNTDTLEKFFYGRPLCALWLRVKNFIMHNSPLQSRKNVVAHYDLGNDFYKLWLDKGMTYSCGLFEGDSHRTLEQAQAAKYERILDRLDAKPNQRILEIGCGWGGFAEAAAKRGCYVTAITLSHQQADYAKARIRKLWLEQMVSIEQIDYREVKGLYDHIVSIGMFEHVGESYWPTFFNTLKTHLKPDGKALVQSIVLDNDVFEHLGNARGFIEEYIFPGGMLPSQSRFRTCAKNEGLVCNDVYEFGQDYVITLKHWMNNFDEHIEQISALGYDKKFIRLWRLYLSSCIASFETSRSSVMQVELAHRQSETARVPAAEYMLEPIAA